jgi:hypothetical protein
MTGAPQARLAVAFARGMVRTPPVGWCDVCADFLAVSGAAITLMAADVAAPLCASGPVAGRLEDAQLTTGEGPGPDAFRTGRPVHVPLMDSVTSARWPAFGEIAAAHGIGAAFSFPLSTPGANVGVLSLYRASAGALSTDQLADARALVQVLTEAVLSLQDDAPVGALAAEIDGAVAYRAETYQASGIVAVQLGIGADDAMVRLRAFAFAHDRPLDSVASAVVDGSLRFDDETTTEVGR